MNTNTTLALAAGIAAFFLIAGCASKRPDPREHTNKFDLDGDGFLTPEEYSASALSDVMPFEDLDIDGDGLLSPRELDFRAGGGPGGRGGRGGKRPGGGQLS